MVYLKDIIDDLIDENKKNVVSLVEKYEQEGRLPCTCRECLLDIVALALNNLKPKYSVSLITDMYLTKEDVNKYEKQIKEAVENAILKVKERPHH